MVLLDRLRKPFVIGAVGLGLAGILSLASCASIKSLESQDQTIETITITPAEQTNLGDKNPFQLIEDSKIQYLLAQGKVELDDNFDKEILGLSFNRCLYLEKNEDSISVKEIKIDQTDQDTMLESDFLFMIGDYGGAREKLKGLPSLLLKYPKLSDLYLSMGDTYFGEEDYTTALNWFLKGIEVNPLNPQLHNFAGDCFLRLDSEDEAKENYYNAIFTCRNYMTPWIKLDNLLEQEDQELVDLRFIDRTRVEEVEKGIVQITIDENLDEYQFLAWSGYGIAKAAWQFELGYKNDEQVNYTLQEKYCLSGLISAWMTVKKQYPEAKDQFLDTLQQIALDGYMEEYIIFEMAAPKVYFVTSLLPEEGKEKIKEYFDKFCVQYKKEAYN